MAAYCLFDNLEVVHAGRLEEYKSKVAPIVARYEGGTWFSAARSTSWKVSGAPHSL